MATAHGLLVLSLLTVLGQPQEITPPELAPAPGAEAVPLEAVLLEPMATPAPEPVRSVLIPAGIFRAPKAKAAERAEERVEAFWLDEVAVTNESFRRFVALYPSYRRGRISPLLADTGYLAHWASPVELGAGAKPEQPVVRVSWFAAKAYCSAQGKRLPTEREWELVASASETLRDARTDARFKEQVLSWYGKPASRELSTVGATPPNFYGVRDLHGLIWEWVLDFNGTLVSSDSRKAGDGDTQAFCGAGALGFADSNDYASFMRTAFRSALTASYTTQSLGFRCARDAHDVH